MKLQKLGKLVFFWKFCNRDSSNLIFVSDTLLQVLSYEDCMIWTVKLYFPQYTS